MEDQLVAALIAKLQPVLYIIGLLVVLGFVSFGGTILSLWFQSKTKKDDSINQTLGENTIAIARLEAKFDLFIERHDKDLNNLGKKVKELSI